MRAPKTSPRPPVAAILVYTLRSAVHGKRWIGLIVPVAACVLLGLLALGQGADPPDFASVAANGLFGLVMPVTCLVVGDSVLGSEIRSGTFAFTWLSPVPTWQIAVGRWLGGTVVASGTLTLGFGAAAIVGGGGDTIGSLVPAVVFGAAAYVALFVAIGSFARRAAVWSLAYVFLVEGLLGTALTGIAQISPGWEATMAYLGLADLDFGLLREGIPVGGAAMVRLTLIAVVALLVTSRRLTTLRLSGASD